MAEPSVAGIVLAAGASRRFDGGTAKQLVEFEGEPLVRRATRQALAAGLDKLVVVVGHEAAAVTAAIADLSVCLVRNPDYATGQSSSVHTGLAELAASVDAALFLPIDQPLLDAAAIDRVLATYRKSRPKITVAAFRGRHGLPVVIDRALFPELAEIAGDRGARQLFPRHAKEIVEARLTSAAPLHDVDTPEDLLRLLRLVRPLGAEQR